MQKIIREDRYINRERPLSAPTVLVRDVDEYFCSCAAAKRTTADTIARAVVDFIRGKYGYPVEGEDGR